LGRKGSRQQILSGSLAYWRKRRTCRLRLCLAFRPGYPGIKIINIVGPYDLEVFTFLLSRCDAAVIGSRHYDVTSGEQLRRLRSGLPPLDVRLDLIELLEGAFYARFGAQYLVDIVRLHAVGKQRKFESELGALAHTALAGEFLGIPEIGP